MSPGNVIQLPNVAARATLERRVREIWHEAFKDAFNASCYAAKDCGIAPNENFTLWDLVQLSARAADAERVCFTSLGF